MGDTTRTRTEEALGASGGLVAQPHLILLLESQRPAAGSRRLCLAGIDTVLLGRGDGRTSTFRWDANAPAIEVRVADPWMSSAHARITRLGGPWTVEDTRSKNGTLVNGAPVAGRVTLRDGDLVEVGHTFFLFRALLPARRDGAPELDSAAIAEPAPGMATLVPHLAGELERLAQLAPSDVSIVIAGESGTGKELAARAAHALSGRRGAFVAVNCGAIPAGIVESELFGHRKGAFSGAAEDRAGHVRSAQGGTLFLDEIGDLPAPAQAALLRVLQEREVVPVGASQPIPVDVRVVAATHRDLPAAVAAGAFRADLYARLAGFTLTLPPLRERREDLGILIAGLLRAHGAPSASFDVAAARAILRHDWPLNVRELDQALSAALVLARDRPIAPADLPAPLRSRRAAASPAPAGAPDPQRDALLAALREHAGNVSAVARAMGKDRRQIQRWLKRYALDPASFQRR